MGLCEWQVSAILRIAIMALVWALQTIGCERKLYKGENTEGKIIPDD